ncbi:uncharacterized protein LOC132759038 [Ruditapes philippinarum]|uniref:uncharacterized protein LOC132759038 n=1 Tax=Ruditapes philippinarum TaxID=129788 RepID=UPI00295B2DE7|nr:uncharacterized protein LOC132759038 [Ruditapes philippinarum]
MYFVAAVCIVVFSSQVAEGILHDEQEIPRWDYFVDIENSFCTTKSNDCGSNLNTSSPNDKCCGQCSCDETTCDVSDSCCVETLGKSTLKTGTKMTCLYPQLKPFTDPVDYPDSEWHYKMFTTCPDVKEINIDLIDKCEHSDNYTDITTKVPVTDEKTLFIYKNQYCAYCHNASDKDLHHWDANVWCFKSILKLKGIRTAVTEIFAAESCNLVYKRPKFLTPNYECKMVISTCNVTGLWEIYDPDIEAGCAAYSTIYNFRYRNVFCYLCNSNETRVPKICKDKLSPTVFVDFTAILKVRTETDTISEFRPAENCESNQIYDSVKV